MPPSMRWQTLNRKKKKKQREQQQENRYEALHLLKQNNLSYRKIERITGVPKSTIALLNKKIAVKDEQGLQQMLTNPNRRGVHTTLTFEEERMIVKRIKVAASRGFAIDYTGIRSIMGRIASDGRKGWKNGIPCLDTVKAFRSRHRDITCRKAENKEQVKIKAESYEHVESFFAALKKVEGSHPGLLSNPHLVWNMDETAVDANEGNCEKVLSGAESHHGGFRGCSTSYRISKHITAVVAVSASGLKAPPFFIIAAKKLSPRWWAPVEGFRKTELTGICGKFTKPNWFPREGVIKVSENGSMEMPIMCAVVKHTNNYVRYFLKDEYFLLCLDGHSSRKGAEWIEECIENRCEAVVSPANTSHFLQPCDQNVNKRFKEAMREIRDEFCRHGVYDTRSVNFNLACGVYAFEQITAGDIISSLRQTGVFPFDRSFPFRYQTELQKVSAKAKYQKERVDAAGLGCRLKSVLVRQTDAKTMEEIEAIFNSKSEASRKIQQIAVLLKNQETENSILMAAGCGISREKDEPSKQKNNVRPHLLDPGAPVEWVTLGDVLERRREQEEEEARLKVEKERKKLEKQKQQLERTENENRRRIEKENERIRKQQAREAAIVEEKRLKLITAIAKEKQSAIKKAAVENAKREAKNAREEALELGRKVAALRKAQFGEKCRRVSNVTGPVVRDLSRTLVPFSLLLG